jgi:hypothetical protein
VDIFEGQDKLDPTSPRLIRKPRAACKKCNGTGSFVFQETVTTSKRRSVFGPNQKVLCSCVKVINVG